MTSYEQTNAAIAAACDTARQALGPLQQAQELIAQAQAQFLGVAEESTRTDAGQAVGQWGRAVEDAASAMQGVLLGVQTAESHAAGT